ncbi:MAG: PhzF family phenazine biosynthesis protein [Cyanobacteria bacterium]|nr:PhzF family phenazine biosynthesis protein [Cyanobacteriota bacterium]
MTIDRFSAFTTISTGGNPAGVWIGDNLPDSKTMQQIAADIGFSETAFVVPKSGLNRTIRYYSPEGEVPFCGHATIATGVCLGENQGAGTYQLSTIVGIISVVVNQLENGYWEAALTSVEPQQRSIENTSLLEALEALNWRLDELDLALPPSFAYAGSWHLVLAVKDYNRLEQLDYNFNRLKTFMILHQLTTLQLIWQEGPTLFHVRNPFPVGGVIEDPATGSAAAALGGYLRAIEYLPVPTKVLIRQGETLGRPSQLTVEIPNAGGIVVRGTAVRL